MILVSEADYLILCQKVCQTDSSMLELDLHCLIHLTRAGRPARKCLIPTLFDIKINNSVKCVNDTDSSLYVDDFGVFNKSKDIESQTSNCLNKTEIWATENGFRFYKTKTQCSFFSVRGFPPDPVLIIYRTPIPVLRRLHF